MLDTHLCMHLRRSLATCAFITCAALALPITAQSQNTVEVGALAPDFAFTTVAGAEHRLGDFRGRPVMLWFYASWCPTCQVGTRVVAEEVERSKLPGLQIIQLQLYRNLGYPGPSAEDFARQFAGSADRSSSWLWGEASLVASYTFDPLGYPDIYFLIDKDGILRTVDAAPHVTIDKIRAFARGARRG